MVSLHIRHSAIQTATWILAICMSEYSGVQIFNFPNLVCFFKESSAGQTKGLSGPDVARGPYFGDPWAIGRFKCRRSHVRISTTVDYVSPVRFCLEFNENRPMPCALG